MREMSIREANQNFSKVIAEAEAGETIIITRNGRPVAKISPQPADRRDDPEWQASYRDLVEHLSRPRPSIEIGKTTRDEMYDD